METPRPRRREFLTGAALTSGAGAAVLTGCVTRPSDSARPGIPPGSRVLFQGDSITDAGRKRSGNLTANEQSFLGNGYASIAATSMLVHHPTSELSISNRGISGNRVVDLAARWDEDCLVLEPDVLSILIGVNDIWHARQGRFEGTVESYERDYDALLERTRSALPKLRLMICEPFVLNCGAVDDSWFPDFDGYRQAAQRVAQKHAASWVPFQESFDRALSVAPPEHWAPDGVHPSPSGAALMAQTWLRIAGM